MANMWFDEAVETLKSCWQNPLKVVGCIALDFVFFFAYGWLSVPVFDKLTEYIIVISSLVSEGLKGTGRSYINNKSLVDILFSPPFGEFVTNFFVLLMLLGFTVYFIYCVFQGIVWKIASEIADYDVSLRDYLRSFFMTNIAWFALFVLYYFGDLFLKIRTTILTKLNPEYVQSDVLSIFFVVMSLVVVYFMILSYVAGSVKLGLKAGWYGWRDFAPPILLILAVFLVIDIVMIQAGMWRLEAAYVLGLVLFLPALTVTKVYIWRVARVLSDNGVLPQY